MFGAGFLLLAVVGSALLRATVMRQRARAEWLKVVKAATLTPALAGMTMKAVKPGAPVVRLLVPSIRLDEVVVEGIDDKSLWAGPGHMPGTVLPGVAGNSVISAHRDRHFHRLDEIRVGDMIETQTPYVQVTWRIVTRQIVGRDERVLKRSDEPLLTLTTCWPTRFVGPAPDRLILTAVPYRVREQAPQTLPPATASRS
ncbi:MAG: class D sortase [Gemmatimonadaceae bacterium]|nr:class D sortase [Gemmatimonadaceae bacterium]